MVDIAWMAEWCGLVAMAVQAVHRGVVGVLNDLKYCDAAWCNWVDVTGGVVAGGATTEMSGKDIRPVANRVTMRAVFIVGLGTICGQIDLDGMIDQAAGAAMVMGREKSGMAGDALAATSNCRALELAVGGLVAGGAAKGCMDLACADEG